MFSTLQVSTTSSLKHCSVHQRAWVESLGQWVTFSEPKIYGSPVMEVACDTCTELVRRIFRAQFPELYSTAYGSAPPR